MTSNISITPLRNHPITEDKPFLTRRFLNQIILPVLNNLHFTTKNTPESILSAAKLLLGTAIQESSLLYFRQKQAIKPALGPYQMEEATFDDLHANFLKYNPLLLLQANQFSPTRAPNFKELEFNATYATVIARLNYARFHSFLPASADVVGQANYWKVYWNTHKGAGTAKQYIINWNLFNGISRTPEAIPIPVVLEPVPINPPNILVRDPQFDAHWNSLTHLQ